MASAHPHHSRYPLPQNSQNDFRLPSLKDLNFSYRSPNGTAPASHQAAELPTGQQQEYVNQRHASWGRSSQPSNASANSLAHQQHTPPLSAGHDVAPKVVDYPSKHENGGFAHPGMPVSSQVTPVQAPVSVSTLRNEDPSHSPNQPTKRTRTVSTNIGPSRDVRNSHPTYPPQYAPYQQPSQSQPPPQATPYQSIPSGLTGPPPNHPAQQAPPQTHEQVHQQHHPIPVSGHPQYATQYQYMQPRPPVIHQQPQSHPPPPQQPSHLNPYPSPGPPPSAPPPQGSWSQQPQQSQQQQQQQHQPPPPPPQHQSHQHQPPQQPQPQHVQQPPAPPTHVPSHHHQPPQQITAQPYVVPHHVQPHPPAPVQQHPPQQHVPQHQPQQTHQPHHYQQPEVRTSTTAIIPTTIEPRPYMPSTERPAIASTLTELQTQCSILHQFAQRYSDNNMHMMQARPSEAELTEMSQRAQHVVRLVEDLRRLNAPDVIEQQQQQQQQQQVQQNHRAAAPEPMQQDPPQEDTRPPKRPWEDISQDENNAVHNDQQQQQQQQQTTFSVAVPAEQFPPVGGSSTDSQPNQSTAEQDMELIRHKRATTQASANNPPGQPKTKYRKRSSGQRATPPGKCHSCNIRETPEWRRGPDGARTLCNACGLHYAKLIRKKDKASGEAVHIDLETLRASARAADVSEKSKSSKQTSRQSDSSSVDVKPPLSQPTQNQLQSSFQLSSMMAPPPPPHSAPPEQTSTTSSSSSMSNDTRPVPPQPAQSQPHNSNTMGPPNPPWATPVTSSARPPPIYAAPDHNIHHQSFMRGSQHAPSR